MGGDNPLLQPPPLVLFYSIRHSEPFPCNDANSFEHLCLAKVGQGPDKPLRIGPEVAATGACKIHDGRGESGTVGVHQTGQRIADRALRGLKLLAVVLHCPEVSFAPFMIRGLPRPQIVDLH